MNRDGNGAVEPAAPARKAEAPYWLTSAQFAELAEIAERVAQKALLRAMQGHTWNGAALVALKQGRAYLVDARSLPEHLYLKFWEANREALTPAAVSPRETVLHVPQRSASVELLSKQYRLAEWLAAIIAPALRFPRGTHGRGEVLRSLAEQTHIRPTDGKPIRFAAAKLRTFCQRFERGGVHALMRKERKGEEKPRYLVNRRWEAACPLPLPEKTSLAQAIEDHVRGLWVAGAPSRAKVRQLASAELAKRCREAGWAEATIKNCDVGQYIVESNQDARRVAVYHRDAKRFADKFMPRVLRDRSALLPGECIVGDVHPVDVYLTREDGSTYTPRMIAWYDLATNRCFWTLVHCAPSKSVTQADVTRSFVDLCMEWGLPRNLYLDNGPEYSWSAMVDGFKALAGMGVQLDMRMGEIAALEAHWAAQAAGTAEEGTYERPAAPENRRDLVRARPYNAAAKPIEGAFSAKEKVFSMLPGYIGGNRMNKRLATVGGKPITYTGTADAFDRELAEAMAFFHATPQRGHLNGLSPEEASAAKRHLATVTHADLVVFLMLFSEERSLKVRTQGVQVGSQDGGKWYFDDALIPLIGTKQRFRIAKWRPETIVLLEGSGATEGYTLIHEARVLPFFDEEGAKESSRRQGIARRHVKQLKAGAQKVDLQDAMRVYIDEARRHRPAPQPLLASQQRTIGLSPAQQALSEQLSGDNPNPVVKLGAGEFRDAAGEIHRLPSRDDIQRETADKAAPIAIHEYTYQPPEPKTKNPFDAEEIAKRFFDEAMRDRRSGGFAGRPTELIQPFAVARTKKESEA